MVPGWFTLGSRGILDTNIAISKATSMPQYERVCVLVKYGHNNSSRHGNCFPSNVHLMVVLLYFSQAK